MIKKITELKNEYNKLGRATKFIIKISLILVFTCFFTSVSCFILKDFVGMYAFLYTVSEELLIVTRSCAFLGLILTVIAFYIEKR